MNTEKQIAFDQIKEMWANLAVTDQAKEKIRNLSFYLDEAALRKEQTDTTNGRNLIETAGTPPLQNDTPIREILTAAEKGACLTPCELERTQAALTAGKRLKDYLCRGKLQENPLSYYEENLDGLDELREEIARQIRNGAVDSFSSKELAQIRAQIAKSEEQKKRKAEQLMRSHKQYMADSYCTLRNGRLCLPVKKDFRNKIPGNVIDTSSTKNTLFIEPHALMKYEEELNLLKIREENEVYRILYTLSASVAAASHTFQENIRLMEKLDFIFSKGKLSIDLDAVEPDINTKRRIVLKDARHPLMDKSVNIPLQFEIGEDIRGLVITGPNTGGKTVAIKTVMLNCMMAQCGLHVTCQKADICMNNSYLCDIGDGQNISQNLSTFSAHIKNVLEILKEISPESLVIMDELGSGTDPAEGMGIAVAVLEELKRSGALFLVTTHYPEVKEYTKTADGMLNAKMTFDKETLLPTYQMVIGEAGESCAFYIADKLGMPKEMLRTAAQAAYGAKAEDNYRFQNKSPLPADKKPAKITKIKKSKPRPKTEIHYRLGDSVLVYPDKKIGIVCKPANEKGILQVQLPGRKIWINHKRLKLHVSADELYPENYDFSILFETVEHRKIRHDMERKYTEDIIHYEEK